MLVPILLWLLAALPASRVTVSTVPCKTVADCWLDEDGKPIARPHKARGRKLPKGDCGKNLLWLRNRLSCEQNVCTTRFVGDAC